MKNKPQLAMMIVPLCLSLTACQTTPRQSQAINQNGFNSAQRVGLSARAGEIGFHAANTSRALGYFALESFHAAKDEVNSYRNYRHQRGYGNYNNRAPSNYNPSSTNR